MARPVASGLVLRWRTVGVEVRRLFDNTVGVVRFGVMKSVWIKFDAGRGEQFQDKGDCQVRALATARGIAYEEAWELLYKLQGEKRTSAFCLTEALDSEDPRFGVEAFLSFPAKKGSRRMNGLTFCFTHGSGSFILKMAHHVAAVVDGQLYDTWNSTHNCVYRAWRLKPARPVLT